MYSRILVDRIKAHITRGTSVVLRGPHGVGKTAMVKQAFDELAYNSLYFSASTMDPYIELVGVPRSVKDGKIYFLDMVKRREFANDEIDAIFIDEYNRSPKEVRNALLELIQYKTIHGYKLNRLKAVVIAINPDDHPIFEYDVEKLDSTQKDKFQAFIDLKFELSEDYIAERYGNMGLRAISWWNNLPDAIRYKVSPRRLCWALDEIKSEGYVEDILADDMDREGLLSVLSVEDDSTIKKYAEENDAENAKKLINDLSKHKVVMSIIDGDSELCEFYLPLIKSNDVLGQAAKNNAKIYDHMLKYGGTRYKKVLCEMLSATKESKFVKPALKSELFDFPKAKEVSNEELQALELINFSSLAKSTEILYSWVVSCKANGNMKQNKKAIQKVIESLSSFDDAKLSTTHYPFIYAELKDEKIKGLFEISNALFQIKLKQYKAKKVVEAPNV